MKICTKCKQQKSETEFYFKDKSKNKRSTMCKLCHNSYIKNEHYKTYRKRHIANVASYKRRNNELLYDYYMLHPCVDCGESNPILLESDHVRDTKEHNISDMIVKGFGWASILKELEKCESRCVACHRKKTAKQRNYMFFQIRLSRGLEE